MEFREVDTKVRVEFLGLGVTSLAHLSYVYLVKFPLVPLRGVLQSELSQSMRMKSTSNRTREDRGILLQWTIIACLFDSSLTVFDSD